MVKEVRSHWVAVQPEFSSSSAGGGSVAPLSIKTARSAYQFFQKENGSAIRRDLLATGAPADVGALGREVSTRWQGLSPSGRKRYEDLAAEDRRRFASESRKRDAEVMEQRERLRRERETLILDGGDDRGEGVGGRATRGARRRGKRRAERKRAKKQEEEKKKLKKATSKRTHGTARRSQRDDDDSDYENDSDGGGGGDFSSTYSDESDDSDESASSALSSSSLDSDDSGGTKPAAMRAPPKVSQATLDRRERSRNEKLRKENYIEARQSEVRAGRADQAKRRLEFLLKQSDIFSHFGNVKRERARLGLRRSDAARSSGLEGDGDEGEGDGEGAAVVRKTGDGAGGNEEAEEEEERKEADEHEATYLTTQPSTLGHGKMRQYQLEGLNWMIRLQENGVNGILADEMGLGKTMQSISILIYMMEFKADNGPHLIIVPKSTLSNWMSELERWAAVLTAVKFHGTKEERLDIAENVLQPGQRDEERTWNVCVTTYEVCNIDRNVFNKFAWSYLIIDEAHRLKNEASIFSMVVRTLETRFRLLLTGTPLQNNLHELWALLNFLVPDVFASAEQFDEWFNLDIADADEKNKLISQLHKILRPFMLRRLKADVEKSLPPKSETILFTGMSAMQKQLYKDILMRDLDTLTGRGGTGGSRTAVLNIVMQLRKCAGHPYLFPGIEDRSLPPLGEHLVENCGKMVLLDKLLVRLRERGHRVLLFTQMTRILDIMEDYMHMRGFQYCRIDGNTTYEEREERINAYNKPNSEKFLFLLSTRAGGLGINLQTADVVILYDSDWNPQADLQAQDRAHRIGQKREVQVFRLVTEDTVEQKVVERAQQKLKLDAMVVQQGRLKEKDKLSRDELLDAIRFGADKIFKSKDSSITDDDIDMILDSGKKKTQELNDKFQAAQKGDMLDFKLDGGLSAQTFEGIDYSEAKNAAFAEELLSAIDMGKRERRAVAYNENQLYQQQVKQHGAQPKKNKTKKEIKLPKMLRLPHMEDWQMFNREMLYALQEVEEEVFRSLPEEVQVSMGGTKSSKPKDETKSSEEHPPSEDAAKDRIEASDAKPTENRETAKESKEGAEGQKGERVIKLELLPPLLSEEQMEEKAHLLAEGFADWSRHHYTAFVKASGKYGRSNHIKIANDVGKPVSAVKTYSEAFWDENFGKKRITEHEYDRAVKLIEKGEKKIEDIKGLQRGTRVLMSLFENPWIELQFTHVNMKDKKFTADEDRFLLCWAHKYGYGQWEAIKFAIRRSSNFRFDYFLKSLPPEAIGRRCEQLMRAAEREVEFMEKQVVEGAKKEGRTLPHGEVKLPMFKELQAKKHAEAERKFLEERAVLENNLSDIENQIEQIQRALRGVDGIETADSLFCPNMHLSDNMSIELANIIARARSQSIATIADEFLSQFPGNGSRIAVCSKIESIGIKEERTDEGDTAPLWRVRPDHMHLLTKETKSYLELGRKRKHDGLDDLGERKSAGAMGPGGDFFEFPEYSGEDEPNENKKAFTLFCKSTRREVKNSLIPSERKNKERVNSILKDRWYRLAEVEKQVWKEWEVWDAKRYEHQWVLYKNNPNHKTAKKTESGSPMKESLSVLKKSIPKIGGAFSIPKKRK